MPRYSPDMNAQSARGRVFLFLQGPHGPFFYRLGQILQTAGGTVWRVGFNAGDRAFWRDRSTYIPYRGKPEDWGETLAHLLDDKAVTDIILYGDTRGIHTKAIEQARARGITIHVFEEGYLRPYWATYERDGSNGNSRLIDMTLHMMEAALDRSDIEAPLPPAHWGDTREHIWYGAIYHGCILFLNWTYRGFRSHREVSVAREFRLYLMRLLLLPTHAVDRFRATRQILRGGFPYHLVLLQLAHDSNFRNHSPFASIDEFLETVVDGFAAGAPIHHHLVFKAHPLEDGRVPLRPKIKAIAKARGIENRVHFVRGGKLARLLNDVRSTVTVNSTAGQQALWRGIPLKAFGSAVYAKDAFVSDQPLRSFFAAPMRPDARAYREFRRYLLETSQIPGSFYSARGRRQLLRLVVDMILSPCDPYDALVRGAATPRQHLSAVE